MSKSVNYFDYIKKVRRNLLAANEDGITQHMLNQKVRTKIFGADDLLYLLEEWERRNWVQKFRARINSRHPSILWRATTLLRDDFSVAIEGNLPIEQTDQSVSKVQGVSPS